MGSLEGRGPQTDKHLPQSPFTDNFFLDDDILFWCLYSYLVHGCSGNMNTGSKNRDIKTDAAKEKNDKRKR
jgi:hypothetical protein